MSAASQPKAPGAQLQRLLYVASDDLADDPAFQRALTLADRAGAVLEVAAPLGDGPPPDEADALGLSADELKELITRHHQEELRQALAPFETEGRSLSAQVLQGRPERAIAREVVDRDVDLVIKVMDAGAGRQDPLAGLDGKLVRSCPCPVWIEQREATEEVHRILVPVDVDPSEHERRQLARRILDVALPLASHMRAELHLLYAWSAYGEAELRGGFIPMDSKKVDRYLQRHQDKRARWLEEFVADAGVGSQVRTHLVKGSPERAILQVADEISPDLIVMGTVARTGILLMGNTAEVILKEAATGLVFVKPPGFSVPFSLRD